MVDALREAHALAVKSTTELTLTIDSEGSRYTITPAAEPTTLPTGVTLRFRDIPYAETKGAIAHIRFFPDSSSTGGTVGLLQGGQQYWIGVNWLTGRVSLRD